MDLWGFQPVQYWTCGTRTGRFYYVFNTAYWNVFCALMDHRGTFIECRCFWAQRSSYEDSLFVRHNIFTSVGKTIRAVPNYQDGSRGHSNLFDTSWIFDNPKDLDIGILGLELPRAAQTMKLVVWTGSETLDHSLTGNRGTRV